MILDRHPLHTYGALESLGHSGTSTYFSHTLLHAAPAHLEHLELQPVLHMFAILPEFLLFSLVHDSYGDAIYQYRTQWLGAQSLDVFIPSLNIGIEYQGRQHYEAIEYFGGSDPSRPTRLLPVPKVSWGYSEEQEALVPAYDVEKAKSLLAEAGYPDGFDIVLTIGTQNAYVQAATLVQEQLKQIGVNVEIQSVSSTEVTDRYLNNKVQLWINGQGGSADPATFVGYFLNSDKIHTNYNAFCYSDPATDAIINEALTLTDQQERKDLYEELNEIALKTNIAAFYATTKLSWGLRKEVHGFVQENKAVMRVCGLEGSGINIWKEK